MIGAGVDVATISKRLGHSNPNITTTIYAQALRRSDTEAADKLEKLFNKNKNDQMAVR